MFLQDAASIPPDENQEATQQPSIDWSRVEVTKDANILIVAAESEDIKNRLFQLSDLGYQFLSKARDEEDINELMEGEPFDVVALEVSGENDVKLLELLKKEHGSPVIALTQNQETMFLTHIETLKPDECLPSVCSHQELLETIERILAEKK